jgi:phosphate transport system substrate-binding protein
MIVTEETACKKETLLLGGSTAFAPLVVAAAAEFSRRACARETSVRAEGSWAGVAGVLTGALDAAFLDVEFHDPHSELVSYPVAAFTVAFVANPTAGVTGLTSSQLRDILTGRVRNWKEVGGADCVIELINRSTASGVRSIVEQRALSNRSIVESQRRASANRVAALQVKSTLGGFSYVALPGVRDLDIVTLAIDNVQPSNDNVLAGMYPFWSFGRIVMWRKMSDLGLRFVDHIVDGSDLCDLLGYIRLNRMTTSVVTQPDLQIEAMPA